MLKLSQVSQSTSTLEAKTSVKDERRRAEWLDQSQNVYKTHGMHYIPWLDGIPNLKLLLVCSQREQ
jgi:hypothetical protein